MLDLYVSVTSTTGRPRDNIKVALYSSQDDAESKDNQHGEGYTDASSVAEILNLNVGQFYWVRANGLFTTRIKCSVSTLRIIIKTVFLNLTWIAKTDFKNRKQIELTPIG